MPSPKQHIGARFERMAERVLERRRYEIIARNWRGGGGEIDRIAWQASTLCFIEVRARSDAAFGSPEETVDRAKQRRIVRAATAYVTSRFRPGSMPMVRFDVVAILALSHRRPDILVIEGAFDAGE